MVMSADGAAKTLDQYIYDTKYKFNPLFGLEVIRS